MFSFLCPKQFWTEHDETLYKGLSSNEFLRGRIRKLSSLYFFFIFFLPSLFFFFFFFFFLAFFALFSSGSMANWGSNDYTGEMGSQFQVNYLPKMIL